MQQTPKQIKSEERSMMGAMILVLIVLFCFQYFSRPSTPVPETTEPVVVTEPEVPQKQITSQLPKHASSAVKIDTPALSGQLSSAGGMLTSLTLNKYKETIAEDSTDVELLSDQYEAYLLWQGNVELPTEDTPWHVQGSTLTPENPIVMTWNNGAVALTRTIRVDEHYMFTFEDMLENKSGKDISVLLNGVIARAVDNVPDTRSSVHTGFVAVADDRLREEAYDKVEKGPIAYSSVGGWTGMTDKYWQTILIPDQRAQVEFMNKQEQNVYFSTFKTKAEVVPAHGKIVKTTHIFAGAKNLNLINGYQKELNIPKFDLTIDFGWFYFLTKPFLYFLQWLYALVGNMGIAILVFATLLRLALLPVATKSYISMAKMKKIQPQMKLLQERYKDDRMRLQQEMMALYKREKVNPAGGCLPMLIQIPVFFALYKVLSVSLQMRQAPFFGWIKDLSAPDPSSVFTLFGLVPWPIPSFLNLGVMPILMGLTMYIQQRMSPQPAGADKAQMNMFKYMPIIFTFMMGQFAVGLIIYWTWSNILSIAQQKYIMKKVG